jgi:FkbM family methyltransferase
MLKDFYAEHAVGYGEGLNVFSSIRKYLKALSISRRCFRNWFSADLNYLLFGKIFRKIKPLTVKCRDGSEVGLNPKLYERLLAGFVYGVFSDLRCRDRVVIADGSGIPLQELLVSEEVIDAIRLGWRYSSDCCWVKDGVKFKHMRHYILEVFEYNEYRCIDVRNRIVVDVGAGYGETTIYFILNGAKHVVAVEPCPEEFKELLENLKLNNAVNRVTPINAALASRHSRIGVECPSGRVFVDTITLGDIAKAVDVEGAVLKMDCEGCEYDIILNDYEHVRLFDEVYFEYHTYATKISVNVLLKKMSKDYKCEVVSDEDFYKRHGYSKKLLGLVKCVKV